MGVGETLAAGRQAAGKTVEDVSRATRIRGELLRRIENDDFAGCGGAVYARGHVRAIATHLGLDAAELVAQYDREHPAEDLPAAREIFEREVVAMPDRKGPNWTAAMAVAAGVLLIVALVSLFNSSPEPVQDARALITPSPTASSLVTPTSAPTSDTIAGRIPGDGVAMRVKIVNTKSYVTVRADGKMVYQGLMTFPAQRDFTAKKLIRVVIGNAAAVNLVVNGQDLGSPGTSGQVVRLEFGPGDPTAAG